MNKKLLGMLLALSLGATVHQAQPFYTACIPLENSLQHIETMTTENLNQQLEESTRFWNLIKVRIDRISDKTDPEYIFQLLVYAGQAKHAACMLELICDNAKKYKKIIGIKQSLLNAINAVNSSEDLFILDRHHGLLSNFKEAGAGKILDKLILKLDAIKQEEAPK